MTELNEESEAIMTNLEDDDPEPDMESSPDSQNEREPSPVRTETERYSLRRVLPPDRLMSVKAGSWDEQL